MLRIKYNILLVIIKRKESIKRKSSIENTILRHKKVIQDK